MASRIFRLASLTASFARWIAQLARLTAFQSLTGSGPARDSSRSHVPTGESVSGLHAYHKAGQIADREFDTADVVAYKLENGLRRLIESLQNKRETGEWNDSFVARESNTAYLNGAVDQP